MSPDQSHAPARPPTVAVVFGTRPEAIKLCPVVAALRDQPGLRVRVWVTGQHREMLQQVLDIFGVTPDADLAVMQPGQTLSELTARLLPALDRLFRDETPDAVLVQGDTTTTFVTSLVAFYHQVRVGHVEAGLRTARRYNPFPEELNRRLTTRLADWHFAPTRWAADNLAREGVPAEDVHTVGNTVVDALLQLREQAREFRAAALRDLDLEGGRERLLLLTTHRRESFGAPMRASLGAIRALVERYPDTRLVFPVHLNPRVREATDEVLGPHPRIHLVEPLGYLDFLRLMSLAHLILTDSGGIQEEAPTLGKPVLVLRETTERPEAVEAGTAVLVGTDPARITAEARRLLEDPEEYARRSRLANPFGDGRSSGRIARIVAAALRGAGHQPTP